MAGTSPVLLSKQYLLFLPVLLRESSSVSGIHSALDQVLSSCDNHHVTRVISIKPWSLTLWIECLFPPKLRLEVFCLFQTMSLGRLVWASNSQSPRPPQPVNCWDYRHAPPCLVQFMLAFNWVMRPCGRWFPWQSPTTWWASMASLTTGKKCLTWNICVPLETIAWLFYRLQGTVVLNVID